MGIRKFWQRLKKSKQISEIILHKKLAFESFLHWNFFQVGSKDSRNKEDEEDMDPYGGDGGKFNFK